MNKNQREALIMAAVCYFWEIDGSHLVENVRKGNHTEVTWSLTNAKAESPYPCIFTFVISGRSQFSFHSSIVDKTVYGDEALQALKRSILAFSSKRGEFRFEEPLMLNEAPKKSLTQKIKGFLT